MITMKHLLPISLLVVSASLLLSSTCDGFVASHRVASNRLAFRPLRVSSLINGDATAQLPPCCPTALQWEVHKFGGASLADASLYRTVGDLLLAESASRGQGDVPTMAIVSAKSGMTDLLVKVVDSALVDFQNAKQAINAAVESQIEVLQELAPPDITDPIAQSFRNDAKDILSVVQSLRMLHTVPSVTMEVVTGFGEIWSAQTLNAYLQTKTDKARWIDARDILVVKSTTEGLGEKGSSSTTGVTPLWDLTSENLQKWWKDHGELMEKAPLLIVTGFVAKTADGVPTTLKRSGSDYSATIFAKLVQANRVTMWKNTDGVYTADPRAVPEAFPIESLKYDEAMELAYFGAQVLHPSAMVPCIDCNIPVYVRNIFNPSFKGTVIEGRCKTIKDVVDDGITRNWRAKSGVIPIKGITSVDKTALVTLEGASDLGGANIAERVMGAMDDAGVNVLIIIQASSESSITLAVPQNQGKLAIAALEDAFELELARSTIGSVSLSEGMSIVAIVGENMEMTSGVAATFMNALARAHVNLRLIAQGSSERQIAVVVKSSDTSRALRAAHMAFTLSETVASVALLGSRGYIGKALCKQLLSQQEKLKKILGIGIAVNVAATSSLMAVSKDSRGLDLTHLNQTLHSGDAMEFHLEKFSSVVESDLNPLRIIVDCTNSEAVAEYYERWLKKGISIISHGRKVGAGPIERYRRVCEIQRLNSVSLCLDTSIGSALPVISTMHDLFDTGDTIKSISGHLSGTFAYALGDFSDEIPFSEAVRMALKQDVPELDLRVDLSGQDTAEKVVTLARQAGLEVSLDDVEVENLLPDFMRSKSYNKEKLDAELLADIQKNMDSPMNDRRLAAERENRKLRYKFHIDLESGKCKCWLDAVPQSDPLYRLKSNEYLVSFDTKRYEKSPLTMKGAAAGPDLTAAGIFADLLRLTRTFASNKN